MKTLFAVVMCAACSGGGGDGDESMTPMTPDARTTQPPVDAPGPGLPDAPAPGVVNAGSWLYSSYTKIADTCGNQVDGDGGFTIDMVTSSSFRINWPTSPPMSASCVTNVSKFYACTVPTAVVDQAPVFDAVVTIDLTLDGHISTPNLATGRQRVTLGCTGTECSQVVTPCSVTADVVLQKVGT
jgi:hypothetical protein